MSPNTFDVIVLGLGAMGSAAVCVLARRGRRVLGVEQFPLVHDQGSSHGHTRAIRKAYFEHPDYVPLLHQAYAGWYELEQQTGRHLFTEAGCLSIGKPHGELVAGVKRAAAEHRLPVEELTGDDVRRRFPAFQLPEHEVGVLERDAGFLYVEECVRAFLDEARHRGAELHENEPVLSWDATASGVTVRTRRQEYTAAKLIITAGAWASQALADLNLPLVVRRKVLLWFATQNDSLFRRDGFPVYMVETTSGFYYGFPVLDAHGLKVARHDGGAVVADPLGVDRAVRESDEMECRQFLQVYLPPANGPRRHGKVCLYTMTPDQHFIVDAHPRHENVVLAAGFSGHGFKFAPVIGAVLADLAEQGETTQPIGMFRLSRFG